MMRERVLRCVEELTRHGIGDAYARATEASTVEYKANVLVGVRTSSSAGTGARVVVDGRLGAAGGTNHVSPAQLVADAREVAAFGPEVGALALGGAGATHSHAIDRDSAVASLPIEALRLIAEAIIDGVRSARPDALVDVTVTRTGSESVLANSLGLVHDSNLVRLSVSATLKRNRDGDLLSLGADGSASRLDDARVSPDRIVHELLTRLARCDRAASLAAGTYPVVFHGDGVAGLLYPLLLGLGGENLARGTSPLSRATPRMATSFSLSDDSSLFAGPIPGARDGDGYAEQRVELVRHGEVVGGLFDAVTAARFARRFPDRALFARPGCARRESVSGTTSPGSSVLAVAPGDSPDVLAGIDRGLFVESLFGVRMGNPISGEFSNSVYIGHVIEHGELVGRVKNVMVAGNAYEALARVDAVGNSPAWVDADLYVPTLRVSELRVSSKG